jgi:hypothetical protein
MSNQLGALFPNVTPLMKAVGDGIIYGVNAEDLNDLLKTDLSPIGWAGVGAGAGLLVSLLGDPAQPGNPIKVSEVVGLVIAGIPLLASGKSRGLNARKLAAAIWFVWLLVSAFRSNTGNTGPNPGPYF